MSRPAADCANSACLRRNSRNSGKWRFGIADTSMGRRASSGFSRNPGTAKLPTPAARSKSTSAALALFRLLRLPSSPSLAAADRTADARFPALSGRQSNPATAYCTATRFRRTSPRLESSGTRAGAHSPIRSAARAYAMATSSASNERRRLLPAAVLSDALRPGWCN